MEEIQGRIKVLTPLESGISKKTQKEWNKQILVIANNEGYEGNEQIFAFEIFGDKEKIDKLIGGRKVGDEVSVAYNIRCNEHNGRYYTSLNAWKVVNADGESDSVPTSGTSDDDALPF